MPAAKIRKHSLHHDDLGEEASRVKRRSITSNERPESPRELSSAADGALPTQPSTPQKSFADLGIIDSLCETCAEIGYKAPTPIQAEAIPLVLQGRDVIGIAETGSGKTAAFALPILQALMDKPQPSFALVLAPTRELAYQISTQFEALGALIGVRSAVLVGGMDMVSQAIALGRRPHVVVATPGRLLDHLENTKGFSLRALRYLVMDEADRLLDLDFGPILGKILKVLPPGAGGGNDAKGRRTLLFSATMTDKVESLQRASLHQPVRVSTTDMDAGADGGVPGGRSIASLATVRTLLQSYLFIPHKHKDVYLVHLLSASPLAGHPAIVFARTVAETQRLTHLLRALGLGAVALHGQLAQATRLGVLNAFRARRRPLLVATDLAARGLDLPAVDAVVNYDLPADSKTYVHRVGRTARAGRSGRAVSLVCQYDLEVWMRVERALGKQVEEMRVEKGEVMALGERVGEAQRVAVGRVRDERERREGRGRVRRNGGRVQRDDMDVDEG